MPSTQSKTHKVFKAKKLDDQQVFFRDFSMRRFVLIFILSLALIVVGVKAATSGWTYLPIVYKSPATPEPTPPKSYIVEVLPDYFWQVMDGKLIITGEVQNNTDDYADYIEIIVDFYNYEGHYIDSYSTYTYLSNALAAGDKTFFMYSITEPPDWSYFEFAPPAYEVGGEPAPNLIIENDGSTWDPQAGRYYVWGIVRNDDTIDVDYTHVIITIYNNSGMVIAGGYVALVEEYLLPGQSSDFMTYFTDQDYADVTYRLQADAWRRE